MSGGRVRVGLIGAGMISDQYLSNLVRYPDVEVVIVGDLDKSRAASQATKYDIARSGNATDVLESDDVEIVVNLTIPAAHVEVSTAAVKAGKHVWSEKPIGVDRASAKELVQLAADSGVLLGIAPDTVLGSMWQTAKRAIDSGAIGTPLSAVTAFQWQGPDIAHPNPDFLFARGAGPLFDMGPYYFSALVHLLGPISEVFAIGTRATNTRMVKVGPRAGESFPVEVPTHVSVLITFENGAAANTLLSFDTARFRTGSVDINGTEGSLSLGDPNYFGGVPIEIYRPWSELPTEWSMEPEILPEIGPVAGRGVGVVTMARTIRGANLHVATGEVGYFVLDVMASIEESMATGAPVPIRSKLGPIPALPVDFDPYQRTLS